MKTRSFVGVSSALTLVLLGAMPFLVAEEPAGKSGEWWEVTSRMSMEGMPMEMPAQTHRVCAAWESTEPPGSAGGPGKCEASDFQRAGDKTTWKVSCSGPPAMSGVGEIVRDGDSAYAGTIRFTSSDGVMTMKISGRRVGGACTVAR